MLTVNEYRRGRNFIRVGDVVRVKALPGKRNGFEAKVRAVKVHERSGEVVEIQVFGGARGQGMIRTFRPERIQRRSRSASSAQRRPPR